MNIGKLLIATLLITVLLSFSGCSFICSKSYYTDTEDYASIWELTGFHHGYEGISTFFPQSLEDLEVKDFICRYDEWLPMGEGVQVFLHVEYSDEEKFKSEVERIQSVSSDASEYFIECGLKAYATTIGEESSQEYALIDEERGVIYYVYSQTVPPEEIEFDKSFLPDEYEEWYEVKIGK